MSPDFDALVIGAGVVGLAVARELALKGKQVLVLEKAARAGTETSARNSEVIHAGIYYPTGTLKARLCVEGRQLLYDYCTAHGVETKRLGKIIAACSPAEETKLQGIKALADANGVTDLRWLSALETAALEPELSCTKALLSPSTGIVDASGFMLSLQGEAEAHGASIAFNTSFKGAARQDGNFVVTAQGADGEITELICASIFNCAGHGAHEAAAAIAGYDARHLPPKFFARGNYCSLSGSSPFKHLIYPVPVSGALGIHATLDLAGAVRFGPNIQWIDTLDYTLQDGLPEIFTEAIATYWPGVRSRTLSPSYCGVRPKTHGPDKSFADFSIQRDAHHGVPGLVNLFGIESPGLTASLAIAKELSPI
ncbi:NAD(P)/FAD-dependent oxidoreductase [Aestuariivirga litoralis]|uniref:NAD(P)/FAD-dependent oxidoreductase n=1 Tax=Aestuariivirga litoralis TaxID=2650924 RepID=UPI0018C712BC|nr:NAD(P)/FAD-dependent oxidoreductase [Aestuariivirga litoralis]MBG1233485.1 NAD(P)/FAD-dependent oxidoreductase [Aestuariivirga litoralis]